ANATNTAVVWPGTLSSAVAYREDLTCERWLLLTLLVPSFAGGLLGAVILVITPEEVFAHIVPFLVLFATLLFAASDLFNRLTRGNGNGAHVEKVNWVNGIWGFSFQLFVATYGGYFGAGMGMLMLASLSLMGLRDIHRMNALKTVLGTTINGVALLYFVIRGLIDWPIALVMAFGAILGGYAGARLAKRVDQRALRILIVIVGLVVSAWLFVKTI
ncbi:MAG TPA: sulfite exporter TauE/SafE family protein, partial [Anaerolineae bacterium]